MQAWGQKHEVRRHIANKILECAAGGDKTLGGLTEAGLAAATKLWGACCLNEGRITYVCFVLYCNGPSARRLRDSNHCPQARHFMK